MSRQRLLPQVTKIESRRVETSELTNFFRRNEKGGPLSTYAGLKRQF